MTPAEALQILSSRPPFSVENEGSEGTCLSSCLSALADAVRELTAAVRAIRPPGPVVPESPPSSLSIPLRQAVNEFLLAKARGGRSDRYLRQLRVTLGALVEFRPSAPVHLVTASDLERWLEGRRWSARTRWGAIRDARTFLGWCGRRGYVGANPASALDRPALVPTSPRIHTPDQVAAALAHAMGRDPGAARLLAVRYFAGIRSAEALRLVEADIAGDFVQVEACKAKTRRRRLVPITPALRAWLDLPGPLPVSDKRMRRALADCPVPMPPNVTRHSWCSYRLADTGNASRTALEAGHAESVLFSVYRERVSPAQAREYWALRPAPDQARPAP